ncbi:MAG: hypothetical protein ACP5SI_06970 [Chloroflexia bacterium]
MVSATLATRDKYASENNIQLDCLERLPIFKARCCTFSFCLTEQHQDEEVARWDYGPPYWLCKRPDGYCVHCDPKTYRYCIFEHRPFVCRAYDYWEDRRIWLDFSRGILAPKEPAGT